MYTQPIEQTPPEYSIQLLKLAQVQEILPVSKTTLWRYVKAGKFPEPRKLGRSTFWVKEEVEDAVRQLVK
ncbi:helix-turn-helix transcriptional regulator [Halodesulfovibrio marinisediminis]|uniref:Transcriptional regulator, AlpA family n=1 Tax=Halodesulfovibrio marinisediminis DSM 17456 TaxID=1121457 RepID=A0A1N6DNR0_9BACT|nr:helix-turn-helix domain-containing protein [Halodesulfovibrio marinisediminis]SIN72449.1 transcriptional regulator, AlpA family [Halodesulfovibrio marinisediminis DSM 17456]